MKLSDYLKAHPESDIEVIDIPTPPPGVPPNIAPATNGAEMLDNERKGYTYLGTFRRTAEQVSALEAEYQAHKADAVFNNIISNTLEYLFLAGRITYAGSGGLNAQSYANEYDGKTLQELFSIQMLLAGRVPSGGTPSGQ